jgi:hypothetical protein
MIKIVAAVIAMRECAGVKAGRMQRLVYLFDQVEQPADADGFDCIFRCSFLTRVPGNRSWFRRWEPEVVAVYRPCREARKGNRSNARSAGRSVFFARHPGRWTPA